MEITLKTVTVTFYLEFQVEDTENKDLVALALETAKESPLEVQQIWVDDEVTYEA